MILDYISDNTGSISRLSEYQINSYEGKESSFVKLNMPFPVTLTLSQSDHTRDDVEYKVYLNT